jgi:hypothetical protein
MNRHLKVWIHDNKLKGNTKYKDVSLEDIPFKYIKWIAHCSTSDKSVKEYYVSLLGTPKKDYTCIHCNQTKGLKDMVQPYECQNIPGLTHETNVCQNCSDLQGAITSAKSIFERMGQELNESNIPVDFVKTKANIIALKRKVNNKK